MISNIRQFMSHHRPPNRHPHCSLTAIVSRYCVGTVACYVVTRRLRRYSYCHEFGLRLSADYSVTAIQTPDRRQLSVSVTQTKHYTHRHSLSALFTTQQRGLRQQLHNRFSYLAPPPVLFTRSQGIIDHLFFSDNVNCFPEVTPYTFLLF